MRDLASTCSRSRLLAAPARWPRAGAAFVCACFAANIGGAASLSEQFYVALTVAWLFDAVTAQGILRREKRRLILPTVIALAAVWCLFFTLAAEQARLIEGRATWHEAAWKMWHIAGLFVLYAVWSRGFYAAFTLLRPKQARRTAAPLWMKLLARGLAIASFAPLIFTSFNVHRTKIGNAFNPSLVKLPYEDVHFFTSDRLRLHGWWIPARVRTSRSVVVCHGVGANSGNFLDLAPFLHGAGFNVLFFDFRGHGDSQGHTVSFGWDEARDVRAACKYLQARGQTQIALYGFSMGAGAVSLSFRPGLEDERDFQKVVRAVIVDSTFAEFHPLVADQFEFLPVFVRFIFLRSLDVFSRMEIGVAPRDISPARVIPRVAPRPLLIIHGEADELIGAQQARALFAAAREPKQLQTVPGAGHCMCRAGDAPRYEKQVAAWLKQAMPER
jgi:alpha-beta hydrolase superfamily lysophospholipase